MARRSQRYTLNVGSDQDFELTTPEWNELLSGGWIEPTGHKTARPRRGVVAWVRGGDLFVMPFAPGSCVTARWFLIWLFRVAVSSAEQPAEIRRAQQEWWLLDMERERQNEAVIWCSRRGKKGKNEFRWMTPQQKAEVMRLKPELIAEAA